MSAERGYLTGLLHGLVLGLFVALALTHFGWGLS